MEFAALYAVEAESIPCDGFLRKAEGAARARSSAGQKKKGMVRGTTGIKITYAVVDIGAWCEVIRQGVVFDENANSLRFVLG